VDFSDEFIFEEDVVKTFCFPVFTLVIEGNFALVTMSELSFYKRLAY